MSPRASMPLTLLLAITSVVVAIPAAARSAGLVDVAAASIDLTPNRYVWTEQGNAAPAQADTPVAIVISIPEQRAYVYRGATLIGASTVSTGKDGKETPVGAFTILQKEAMHRSNLYDSAPMPYMQRLTWDGVALHAGNNPGFPDSHGCVRLPSAFARKLFAATRLGGTVVVTDEVIDPASYGEAIPNTSADDTAATARANRVARDIDASFGK